MMRKVDLSMEENEIYETIKTLVDNGGNKLRAKIKLDCSMKTVNRMIAGYKSMGKDYFTHGNKGRKPANTVPDEKKESIVKLYKDKYYDANFAHFTEFLNGAENMNISYTSVRKILKKENILSPKSTRKTKKDIKKILEEKLKNPKLSDKEVTEIIKTILDAEDAHPRRPRSAYFGELIQMDASLHNWFGNDKCQLHLAVDDSTGRIVGAYFDYEETLKGYYNIFNQILVNYGVPYKFLTDKRTVFEYKKKSNNSIENDTYTQFGYACKEFGIELQSISVPQAKGRVERMFGTLQSRLPVELRLADVTDIVAANEFLNSYIKEFNAKFALPINPNKSVFEDQPSNEKINLTLAVLSERKVDSGHCIKYENKLFKTVDRNNNPVYHQKGTVALVVRAFNGEIYATINDIVYALEEVAPIEKFSKNFDNNLTKIKSENKYIPPMTHPWKRDSFKKFISKQSHLQDKPA